jgi:hypothetical protein
VKFNGINTDRLESFARRLLGIRQSGIMPTLSPEATVEIALPFTMDQLALSGAWPFGAASAVTANAAEFPMVSLSNNSPNLIVVAKVLVAQSSTGTVTFARASGGVIPGAVAANEMTWRDTRRPIASFPSGTLFFEQGSAVAIPPAGSFRFGQRRVLINEQSEGPEFVLSPGQVVAWFGNVAASQLHWSCEGSVRPALIDELTAS